MLLIASAGQGQQALAAGELACPGLRGGAGPVGMDDTAAGPLPGLLRQPRPAPGRLAAPTPRWGRRDRRGLARRGLRCRPPPVAAGLNRPAGTVRGWLRAAREQAGWLHAELASVGARLPEHRLGTAVAPPTPLGETVQAAGRVASAYRRHLGPGLLGSPWQLLSQLTNGWLLAPAAAPS